MNKSKRFWLWVPTILFLVVVIFLGIGLTLDPRRVPSPLIDKPVPVFELETLHNPEMNFSSRQLTGRVVLVNVWASWCVSCRAEHEVLKYIARTTDIPLIGLNYKDERTDGLSWLNRLGNPYELSLYDRDGRVGIDWGVYGVPETFVIDSQGIIRHKHIGPITEQAFVEELAPLVQKLRAEQGGA